MEEKWMGGKWNGKKESEGEGRGVRGRVGKRQEEGLE